MKNKLKFKCKKCPYGPHDAKPLKNCIKCPFGGLVPTSATYKEHVVFYRFS